MPKRLARTVTVDYSQHNPRIQLTLAECLLGLGFGIPGGIHPGTTSGTDIVVQWPGRPATMHIEVEVIKSGSLKTKIPQWLRKLNAAADARALVIVVHDTGWARTLIQSNPKPVHCVAFEDWAHLVPTLYGSHLSLARRVQLPILRPLLSDGMMRPSTKEAPWTSGNGVTAIGVKSLV